MGAAMSQVYQPQTDPTTHTMHQTNTVAQIDESYGEDGYDYGGYGEEDPYEGAMMDTSAGGDQNKGFNISEVVEDLVNKFVCTLCGVEFKDKSNCRRHVKSVHMFDQVKCNICGATLK